MKLSKGFWQTFKETPADAKVPSHQLMMRAGLLHKSAAGIYSYLPMGYRVIRKVEQIIREEMDKIDCMELLMPVVTPGELWQESGRWDVMGAEMLTFKDKKNADLCISPTNEEAIVDIFRKVIKSYKQLPITLYQINTKFRDEIRPRFGLMRGREFIMKDAYSFHTDKSSLDNVYDMIYKGYENCFNRIGVEFFVVEADAGAMGSSDSKTHEFQVIAETGEDEIIYSEESGYAANLEKAQTKRSKTDFSYSEDELKETPTPKKETIEDVCDFLKKPKEQSLKSLVYKIVNGEDETFCLSLLIGDDDLNEVKLKNYFQATHVSAASENEIESLGLVKGFIGPIGVDGEKVKILFDSAIDLKANFIVGAGKSDIHFENFIPKREMKEVQQVDLRLSKVGDLTLDGKNSVKSKRGIEVGHIFQLGTKYTDAMSSTILDSNGKAISPLMGCYGLGVTRTVAAAIEQNHDENGIIWPVSIAPYQIYFAAICKSDEFKQKADNLYKELLNEELEVVYDDRKAGAGFKFKDADLLGLPLRLVLGERDFKETGELEIVERASGKKHKVQINDVKSKIQEILAELA